MKSNQKSRADQVRAPALIVIVVLVHALAVSAIMFMQGCGTTQTASVEPPPAPVMPPKPVTQTPPILTPPKAVFHPPVPVEPAPSLAEPAMGPVYTVQSGDALSKIAVKAGVSTREIAELNKIRDANKIRVGQKLILPAHAKVVSSGASAKSVSKPKASTPKVEIPAQANVYVVRRGDSLSKIASKHGIKTAALREANKISGDKILIGQKLIIPGASVAAPAGPAMIEPAAPVGVVSTPPLETPPPKGAPMIEPVPAPLSPPAAVPNVKEPQLESQDNPLDYTVQEGDTLDDIAKLFIVGKEDIMSLNGISDASSIKPGQKIKIPPSSP